MYEVRKFVLYLTKGYYKAALHRPTYLMWSILHATLCLGHTKLISCFWSYKSLKMTRPPGFFFWVCVFSFFFFLRNQSGKKMVYKQQNACIAGWRLGTRLQNADNCVSKEPKYRSLKGEATECRVCKHCGCMLNTDYIWLHKSSSSEKIDLHALDQKQE